LLWLASRALKKRGELIKGKGGLSAAGGVLKKFK